MQSTKLLVLTNLPDRAVAEKLADLLIAKNLAACVNILAPCRSVYRWKDAVQHDEARALDLGCGTGWSSVALAQAFPSLTVLGVDSDEASVLDARRNATEAGVGDRVDFEVASAAAALRPDSVDVGFFLECLHDMGHPVEALAAVRSALRPGGRVVVMDELAAEEFGPDGSPTERLYGAASILHCLPVGMSEAGSAGTGALFRPATMRAYAAEAGYADVEVLPIEHDFMRFYLLRP